MSADNASRNRPRTHGRPHALRPLCERASRRPRQPGPRAPAVPPHRHRRSRWHSAGRAVHQPIAVQIGAAENDQIAERAARARSLRSSVARRAAVRRAGRLGCRRPWKRGQSRESVGAKAEKTFAPCSTAHSFPSSYLGAVARINSRMDHCSAPQAFIALQHKVRQTTATGIAPPSLPSPACGGRLNRHPRERSPPQAGEGREGARSPV